MGLTPESCALEEYKQQMPEAAHSPTLHSVTREGVKVRVPQHQPPHRPLAQRLPYHWCPELAE